MDIDSPTISLARRVYSRFIERGLLAVKKRDLTRLHYLNEFFDYSINHTTMHHMDDIETAVRELWSSSMMNIFLTRFNSSW